MVETVVPSDAQGDFTMNSNLIYVVPELLELDVPGGVFAGESGRNKDMRAEDDKTLWRHYTDDTDDDVVSDADAEDIP